MKAVILAGGFGTRLSEESHLRPKPMVEIGGKPILWHIMKLYSAHDVNEFVICCGFKGYVIKEYFANYFLHTADVTFDLANNSIEVHHKRAEPWKVTVVDTGEATMTGGRLRRVRSFVEDGTFCFTYGDGLADVDIRALIAFHREQAEAHGIKATLTGVRAPGRFGVLRTSDADRDRVTAFEEKPTDGTGWINGGFFVLEPGAIDYIDGDESIWEHEPVRALCANNELSVYRHTGFWQPMDTLRERNLLNSLWEQGKAPWKRWD
ncbi:MAG: glucose-1-phosphate cytidylyltransferase [Planctomycetota bacterium]